MVIGISGFRYKWAVGSHLWTDINEIGRWYYVSINKVLMEHDPINIEENWRALRLEKNIFVIVPENESEEWKEAVEEKLSRTVESFSVLLKESSNSYAFFLEKNSLKESVDDLRSWTLARLDKNFFMLYPHVISNENTEAVLKQLKIISE